MSRSKFSGAKPRGKAASRRRERKRTPTRATPTQRGYGTRHKTLRRKFEAHVQAGQVNCWRCGQLIVPGTPWDLGHDDNDRTLYRGPEHRKCNRRAGMQRANANRTPKGRSRKW